MSKKSAKFKLGIICGGPSLERGISLNSARSAMDHLGSDTIEIIPIYVDSNKRFYKISKTQLYSNTPSDFDFKLKHTATPLNENKLIHLLRTIDITFPLMHGQFGEDGKIQSLLEKYNIPFVGSGSSSCKLAFDKFNANEYIARNGFFAMPSIVLKIYQKNHKKTIEQFFKNYNIARAIVKVARGGSSIGVFSVLTPGEALERVNFLFSKRMDTRVVIEPFAQGTEFTMIILENRFGLPVALPPTEIETDYTKYQIFDFRRKYLPTRQVAWHCPPRIENETIEKIQTQGEHLFKLFHMRDFARFDGWILPNRKIWFCDFNPISGMEQNSFLFQQSSQIGMTHSDILRHIVKRACDRYNIRFPEMTQKQPKNRNKINILMGGNNSERQVSLMSGTNVWLKLRRHQQYQPQPHLLDTKGNVWKLPYNLCLNHTVEEIADNCANYQNAKTKLSEFEERARTRLGFQEEKNMNEFFEPKKLTLEQFIKNSNFVFIALHGGNGENGNLQKLLKTHEVEFNGPEEKVSRLCIDKLETANFIDTLNIDGINTIPRTVVETNTLLRLNEPKIKLLWRKMKKGRQTLIVKPRSDGCTTGIAHLFSENDLKKYIQLLVQKAPFIPKRTFRGQLDIIEMPTTLPHDLLFEKFVETDFLRVKKNKLKHVNRTGWLEITVGVIETKNIIRSLNPSITVAEGEVLTVEEKFQGGTGVNITPPPPGIMKHHIIQIIKNRIEELAQKIGIRGYSRIDAFANIYTGDLLIIEINTLPGLTPSTVLFHQGLAEDKPLFPHELIELLIQNKGF